MPTPHNSLERQATWPGCYDYTGAVLFNACAPELWRRFTIALRRALARRAGLTNKALAAQVRVSYAKVAEYQRRGVVHFHAIIRLDGPAGPTTPRLPGRPTPCSPPRLLLTVPEAAEALAISRSKLYELLASGAVASIRIDGSRRVPLTALEEYISRLLAERTAA